MTGDLIHDYFDCVFHGTIQQSQYFALRADGLLECPFYARSDAPFFSDDEMCGDHRLPSTCGSRARRSIIEYFFKDYYARKGNNNNLTKLITEKVAFMCVNYSSQRSMG